MYLNPPNKTTLYTGDLWNLMISDEALYNEAIAPEYPKPSLMLEGRK